MPRTRKTPTHTAADSPMPRNATAPGSGLGSSGGRSGDSGSLTSTGAHDDAHLTPHATSPSLRGAWRAGVHRPNMGAGGRVGRGEVDGVHRAHHRIWAL